VENKNSVFKVALILSVVSILSRPLGFIREQVIAWRFGAGATVDAYVAAMFIPQLLAGIIGGILPIAFLPVYSEDRDTPAGSSLVATTTSAIAVLAIAGSALALVFAPALVRLLVGSFSAEQQALTVSLLQIMSFGTFLLSLAAFLTILFNSHGQFFLPALIPVLQNVIIIAGLFLLGAWGIDGLAWSTLASMGVTAGLLFMLALYRGFPVIATPKFWSPNFIKVLKLSAPIFVSSLFGQVYMVVDRRLASGLDVGSIAALNFANRLVQLPVSIFVAALATAAYPTLAALASRGDKKGFAETTIGSLRGLVVLLVPATVGLWVLRYPIVRLAFERGSFDADATAKTAYALGFYALGLLGLATAQVLSRAFFSLHDTLTPVKIGIATSLLNTFLALVLVIPLAHGGLALANSLGASVSALWLFYALRKKLGPVPMGMVSLLFKVGVSSLVMGLTSAVVMALTAGWGQIISLGAAVGAGLLAYGICLLLAKVDEVARIMKKVQDKFGKKLR